MAGIASVADFLAITSDPRSKLGLHATPATPWYFGQPDLKSELTPALYKSGIRPEHEREVLRDWRQMSAEFGAAGGLSDAQIMIKAHLAGVPTRVLEWSANPLAALFLAVESLSGEDGRVWVLNPWVMNEHTSELLFVPPVDSPYFPKYTVKLDALDTPGVPEAAHPMAFRPQRSSRAYNAQSIFWTVHGKDQSPLDKLVFFMKRADLYLNAIPIPAAGKKPIMKELHDIGVTRANLFPGAGALARTLAYRYSKNYLGG